METIFFVEIHWKSVAEPLQMGTLQQIFLGRNKNNICDIPLNSSYKNIAPDKGFFFIRKVLLFFLFLHKNISCGY